MLAAFLVLTYLGAFAGLLACCRDISEAAAVMDESDVSDLYMGER